MSKKYYITCSIITLLLFIFGLWPIAIQIGIITLAGVPIITKILNTVSSKKKEE